MEQSSKSFKTKNRSQEDHEASEDSKIKVSAPSKKSLTKGHPISGSRGKSGGSMLSTRKISQYGLSQVSHYTEEEKDVVFELINPMNTTGTKELSPKEDAEPSMREKINGRFAEDSPDDIDDRCRGDSGKKNLRKPNDKKEKHRLPKPDKDSSRLLSGSESSQKQSMSSEHQPRKPSQSSSTGMKSQKSSERDNSSNDRNHRENRNRDRKDRDPKKQQRNSSNEESESRDNRGRHHSGSRGGVAASRGGPSSAMDQASASRSASSKLDGDRHRDKRNRGDRDRSSEKDGLPFRKNLGANNKKKPEKSQERDKSRDGGQFNGFENDNKSHRSNVSRENSRQPGKNGHSREHRVQEHKSKGSVNKIQAKHNLKHQNGRPKFENPEFDDNHEDPGHKNRKSDSHQHPSKYEAFQGRKKDRKPSPARSEEDRPGGT